MFFYIVLTPISTTSCLSSTDNMRKYQQIDVYIYQCVKVSYGITIIKTDIGVKQTKYTEQSANINKVTLLFWTGRVVFSLLLRCTLRPSLIIITILNTNKIVNGTKNDKEASSHV